MTSPVPSTEEARLSEADAVKAVGILAVVLIHCMRSPWAPDIHAIELWILHVTAFAVPGFIAVSGFLYAGSAAATGRRLRRILGPYLVASACAQVYRVTNDLPSISGSVVGDVLLGASFGPYYYVFVIVPLILLVPLVARIPRGYYAALLAVLVGATFVSQGLIEAGEGNGLGGLMYLRNPALFWSYFFLGWVARLHRPGLVAMPAEVRRRTVALLAVASAACLVVIWADLPRAAVMRAAGVNVYVILALICLLAQGRSSLPAWVRWLSDSTYAIYLFHLFFMYPVEGWLQHDPGTFALRIVVARFAVGLGGAIAFIVVARRLLGRFSRFVIGA